MGTIVWTNSTEPPLEYKWSDATDYSFWVPDPSAHTLTVEALPPHTHPDWVLGDLAAVQANAMPHLPSASSSEEYYRMLTSGRAVSVPITHETAQRIRDGLLAVVAQIEAEQKAAPVMNAIQATHNAFRSDGRPHFYVDPLRAPDA